MAFSLPQLPFSRREIIVCQRLEVYTGADKRLASEISAYASFCGGEQGKRWVFPKEPWSALSDTAT